MGVRSMCVHGTADDEVPLSQSQRFVAAARRAGDDARLLVCRHRVLLTHRCDVPAWAACRTAVLDMAR